ncbi:hypothetical protein ABE504_02800 [Paenibacillus oryzisoli]|uniref:hypothetical protein n=1 Tax=Paenibacillus oryzisoli TaxID=1850517 RepID=UPI003D2AFBBD
MFEGLIRSKQRVKIRCGKDEIEGVISHFYAEFGLLRVGKLIIPIACIEQIEEVEPEQQHQVPVRTKREPFLRLVSDGRHTH